MCRITASLLAAALTVALGAPVATVAGAESPSVWLDRRPLSVAHAGGDLEAPHSTPYAFERAVAEGADVLEMDVRLSADGEVIVHHDDTVNRITDGSGLVSDLTVDELQALDAGYWFVPDCWSCHGEPPEAYALRGVRTGDRPPPPGYSADDFVIPTLRQILDRFPDRMLDIEIKGSYPADVPTAHALAGLLAEYGRTDDVLIASFDDALLGAFKDVAPEVPTSPGLGRMTEWFFDRGPIPDHAVLQVPPSYSGLTVVSPEMVADAHAAGLAVWVWFNGNSEENAAFYEQMLDAGVDALLNSKPALAQVTLEGRGTVFRNAFTVPAEAVAGRFGRANVELGCPERSVAWCRGVALAWTRDGRWQPWRLLGARVVEAAAGTSANLPVRVRGAARSRLARIGRLDVRVLVVPVGDDTAPTDTTLVLKPR